MKTRLIFAAEVLVVFAAVYAFQKHVYKVPTVGAYLLGLPGPARPPPQRGWQVPGSGSPAEWLSRPGRVEMWRGSSRPGLSVAAPFVWRCPSNLAVAPFPHPAHR